MKLIFTEKNKSFYWDQDKSGSKLTTYKPMKTNQERIKSLPLAGWTASCQTNDSQLFLPHYHITSNHLRMKSSETRKVNSADAERGGVVQQEKTTLHMSIKLP